MKKVNVAILSGWSWGRSTEDAYKSILRFTPEGNGYNVFVKTSIEKCKERDVKGMWKRALNGEIKNFTGLDGVWEEPYDSDIVVNTEKHNVEECCRQIFERSK